MLGLLYFGRLEQEKGVNGIIEMIHLFGKKGKLPFELFVFGSGSLENEILGLAKQYPEIHFFGWKSLEEIKRYTINCQYCLMPSNFLETFGLTALTALTWGLPVIGYKKGGLIPFVEEGLDLAKQEGQTTGRQLYHLVSLIVSGQILPKLPLSMEEIEKYTKESWKKNIKSLLGDKKKILLVSDFVSKVGGIETYLHDVKVILEESGYEVHLFGTNLSHGFWGKLKKLLGIGWGSCNFVDAIRLRKLCLSWKPDLVWYHSTLRWMGWMPVWATKNLVSERWMMYHDFGYFTPYPSQLTDIHQIKTPMNINHFFAMGKTKNPIRFLLLLGKYIALTLLKRQLTLINTHFVPSDFMKPIVHKSYTITEKHIVVLHHFLQ